MKKVELAQISGILRSLKESTKVSLAYQGIILSVDGRNSEYLSHTSIDFDDTCAKLNPVDFDFTFYCKDFILFNEKYVILIDLSLDEGFGDRHLNDDIFEWVDIYIPLQAIKDVVETIPGEELLGIEFPKRQNLARVCYPRNRLDHFGEDGRPVFVKKEEDE